MTSDDQQHLDQNRSHELAQLRQEAAHPRVAQLVDLWFLAKHSAIIARIIFFTAVCFFGAKSCGDSVSLRRR
jgi:hypothetical protein